MCVYLLLLQRKGQKATAVAESPTSKMEEHGFNSGGSTESLDSSNLCGAHTITWGHTHTNICSTQICIHYLGYLNMQQLPQKGRLTFLSRLDVTKYLLSGLQSHDQMIRLCMAVSFPVCACSENRGSAWAQTNKKSASKCCSNSAYRWSHLSDAEELIIGA